MHVVQLLLDLGCGVNLERVEPHLPDGISLGELRRILRHRTIQKLLDRFRAPPLPLLHEPAQLSDLGEPDEGMHMVGHDDESYAAGIELEQFIGQDAK